MDQASAFSRSKFNNTLGLPPVDGVTAARTSPRAVSDPRHPVENSRDLLVVLQNDAIDVEEERRLEEELREATQSDDDDENYLQILKRHEAHMPLNSKHRASGPPFRGPELGGHDTPPSVFSDDIWLGDNSGSSSLFAREVEIRGWTSVGDKLGGAYIVYECVVRTKEGTILHAHKRYNAFEELSTALHRTLPVRPVLIM